MRDIAIIKLYETWSEAFWCAQFMSPTPEMVRRFRAWLHWLETCVPEEDFEIEMLAEFHRQEEEALAK